MGQSESTAIGRTPVYTPSVNEFVINDEAVASPDKQSLRVIVIGSGCAGLAAAWHLYRAGMNVKLIESEGKLGGHANTIQVDGVDVDTGFMVYNKLNYPHLLCLFEELGIQGEDTTMGFSVSMDNGTFEYAAGETLSKLFATRKNLFNPYFYGMMWEILRFNKLAKKFLESSESHVDRSLTAGEFLKKHGFSEYFTKRYLVPMTGAIWSSSNKGILSFPALTLFTFLNNHLLLQVTGNMTWKTPASRSKEYVQKIGAELGEKRVFLNKKITAVKRTTTTDTGKTIIAVTDNNGNTEECDIVVFACHPDQALQILNEDSDSLDKSILPNFKYSTNDTYVHSDINLMPRSQTAWTCWNYIANASASEAKPVFVTYWLNKLQNLKHSRNIFVSLNPAMPPAADKTYARIEYSHPQYTTESVRAQRLVAANQGRLNTYYCGAWMGYGFHEDGFRSGIEVATLISGVAAPWVRQRGYDALMPASKPQIELLQQSLFHSLVSTLNYPLTWLLQTICKQQVLKFMKKQFMKGSLSFISPDGSKFRIVGPEQGLEKEVVVRVKNPWIWVRIAFESDLGMAKSYLAGEWEVDNTGTNYDGLTQLMLVLLDNVPNGKSVKPGFDFNNLFSSWVGSVVNWLSYRFTMDNSISNSRSNIHAHYDLSNELYKTFLDKDHMMYSCGIFETKTVTDVKSTPAPYGITHSSNGIAHSSNGITHSSNGITHSSNGITHSSNGIAHSSNGITHSESCTLRKQTSLFRQQCRLSFSGSLETAQARKISALLRRLEPLGPEHTLLDIGFGWGGICIYAAEKYGCHVTGITLSKEQTALAQQRVNAKGLSHLMTFELIDYREFAKVRLQKKLRKYDRIVSCEMIEAVGHNYLNSFFQTVDSLLDVEGIFVMQAITMPDARYPLYVKSADFLNTVIFPGGCCPSLGALLQAMSVSSTLHLEHAVNMNVHYAETLRQWRRRFNQNLPRIIELGFDDSFIRLWNLYLCQCEAGFDAQIINLQILTFSRTGNPNMMSKRALDFVSSGMQLL